MTTKGEASYSEMWRGFAERIDKSKQDRELRKRSRDAFLVEYRLKLERIVKPQFELAAKSLHGTGDSSFGVKALSKELDRASLVVTVYNFQGYEKPKQVEQRIQVSPDVATENVLWATRVKGKDDKITEQTLAYVDEEWIRSQIMLFIEEIKGPSFG